MRTIRLVVAAVVRRACPDEDTVEEIRLAIGEACAVLVGAVRSAGPASETPAPLQESDFSGDDQRLHVRIDTSPSRLFVNIRGVGIAARDAAGGDPWALLRGLSDDLVVDEKDGWTAVAMSWSI